MYLEIDGEQKIGDVQSKFSSWYPYLRIEFISKAPASCPRHRLAQIISGQKIIKDVPQFNMSNALIRVSGDTTVRDLEDQFFSKLGLTVQVLRKSGNLWLETLITDRLTLRQQDDHGREISLYMTGTARSA